MKARYFRKLRAKVSYYQVITSYGLFGDFPSRDFGNKILAKSFENAIERNNRRYEKKYKQKSNYTGVCDETTEEWGKVKVVNDKGYKKYFR